MSFAPLQNIVFINAEFGSGCPSSEGPRAQAMLTPDEVVRQFLDELGKELNMPVCYYKPGTRQALFGLAEEIFSPQNIFLSPDNAVSYALLRAARERGHRISCNIVGDQHQDIYSYLTHGEELTKANPYRFACDQGLIDYVVFFGSRELEIAFHDPFLLRSKSRYHPVLFAYALLRHFQGQHDGLKAKFTSIPAAEAGDFGEATAAAMNCMWDHFRHHRLAPLSAAFEIDLDVFDSEAIRGVDYGLHLPGELRRHARVKFLERLLGGKQNAEDDLVYDLMIASYIERKIRCLGIAVPDGAAIEEAVRHVHCADVPFKFFHITELKLEHDDPEKQTRRLVKDLIRAAVLVSHEF